MFVTTYIVTNVWPACSLSEIAPDTIDVPSSVWLTLDAPAAFGLAQTCFGDADTTSEFAR
ncbi:MAG: hypothetical protein NT133_00255 [Alphaproteobacteria bacterium]|nr:hypothetical protein [Alphaproteobacteria bacterium]